MTPEQYLKAQLGELFFALAVASAERDAVKARVIELEQLMPNTAVKTASKNG